MSHRTLGAATALALTCVLLPAAATAATTAPASCSSQLDGPATTGVTSTKVLTGTFSTAEHGRYVEVPFDVPAGTTQVHVTYCYTDTSHNTLDLGIYQPNADGSLGFAIPSNFRGWGGSSHPEVALSPQGFSTEAQYNAKPKGYVAGRTTRGFEPGPIPAGTWAAELGVAAVRSAANGGDDLVGWRVEVELSNDPAYAATPYKQAAYSTKAAKKAAGWYAGDFHVHDEHSNLGAATITDTLNDAFGAFTPASQGAPFRAGLDFTSLSDYVTDSAWGEIGRYQGAHPGKLVIPSAEVITYEGHTGNQGSLKVADYRTGQIDRLNPDDGSLSKLRDARPPSTIFDTVHSGGGVTVLNHPRIFPPTTEAVAALCRGCFWGYTDAQTDFSKVDAIELFNSPEDFGFRSGTESENPFNRDALVYWNHALDSGAHIAAVGGSDTHHAGSPTGATEAPVGRPATMVYASALDLKGILAGVKAGHTYVKTAGTAGPGLTLTAKAAAGKAVMMGDSISGRSIQISTTISGSTDGKARTLELQRNGVVIKSMPVLTPTATMTFTATKTGRYNVVVERAIGAGVIDAVTSPIYVSDPPRTPKLSAPRACVKPGKSAKVKVDTRLTTKTRGSAAVTLDGRKVGTVRTAKGSVTIPGKKLRKAGSHKLAAVATTRYGLRSATATTKLTVCSQAGPLAGR